MVNTFLYSTTNIYGQNQAREDLNITEVYSKDNVAPLKVIQRVGRYVQDVSISSIEVSSKVETEKGEKRVAEVKTMLPCNILLRSLILKKNPLSFLFQRKRSEKLQRRQLWDVSSSNLTRKTQSLGN